MRYGSWLLVGVAVAALGVGSRPGWGQQMPRYPATNSGPVGRAWDADDVRTPATNIPSGYPYPTTSSPDARALDAYRQQPATVSAWNQPPTGYPYPTAGINEEGAGFAEATDRFRPQPNPAPVYNGPSADSPSWARQQPPPPDYIRQQQPPDYARQQNQPPPVLSTEPDRTSPPVPTRPMQQAPNWGGPPPDFARQSSPPDYARQPPPGYPRQQPPSDYTQRPYYPTPGPEYAADRNPEPPPAYVRQEPAPRYGGQQSAPDYVGQQPPPGYARQELGPAGPPYRKPGQGQDFPRVAARPTSRRPAEATRAGQAPKRPAPECTPCLWAQPLAQVGHDVVLASEVMPEVIELLEKNADRIPEWQVPAQRLALIQQLLSHRIETKLLCQDAIRTLPKEAIPRVEDQLGERFEKVKIEELMKQYGASSRRDLENKLQAVGSSLSRKRREFSQREMAALWLREKLGTDLSIDREELEAYYHEHIDEYRIFAQSRWQQLTARVSKHDGDKQAAWDAICRMGNMVVRQGVPFDEVAKRYSDDTRADSGGMHDWTRKDSLKSKVLDRAIFTQPIGEMGPIIEDEQGFHIVRVTERHGDGVKSFEDLQDEIRDKLVQERRMTKFREYMEKLRETIPVSTIFEDKVALRRFSEHLDRMEPVARRETPRTGF